MPSPRRERREPSRRRTWLQRIAALAFLVVFAAATVAVLHDNGPIGVPFRDEAARVPCNEVQVRRNDAIWSESELLHGEDLARVRRAARPLDDKPSLAKALVRCGTLDGHSETWIRSRLGDPDPAYTGADPSVRTYVVTDDGFEAICTMDVVYTAKHRVQSTDLSRCD